MTSLARLIADDIAARRTFDPRADQVGPLENAYRIQGEVTALLARARPGRQIAGYKIAFNRASSLTYYGLSEPCYAPLFADELHPSGVSLPKADYIDLVIEPEIAVRLAAPLDGGEDAAALLAAVGAYIPAIELMDPRGAFAHDPSAAAAVAQRIYSRGAVLGAERPQPGARIEDIVARLSVDGIQAGEATGAAPQPPLEALGWLARRLARDGVPLEPGMVVLTGTHLPGFPLPGPARLAVEFEPLGAVSVDFA